MSKSKDGIDDSCQEKGEDLFKEENDDRPVLYELRIRPPKRGGKGKEKLVSWWNRTSHYKIRRLERLRRHKKKEAAR